jgi:hypothetical protein
MYKIIVLFYIISYKANGSEPEPEPHHLAFQDPEAK